MQADRPPAGASEGDSCCRGQGPPNRTPAYRKMIMWARGRGDRLKAGARGDCFVDDDSVFRKIVGHDPSDGGRAKALAGRDAREHKFGEGGRLSRRANRLSNRFKRGQPVLMLVRQMEDVAAFG